MKASDARNMTESEIQGHLREKRALLRSLRFNHGLSPIENPARLRALRKEIAVLLTVLGEQKRSQLAAQSNDANA